MRVYHGDKRDSVVRARNPIPKDAAGFTQTSILPNNERGIDGIMRTINGRTDRRFYAPAVSSFWRPPAEVEAAISRGNKKCWAVS